MRQVTPPSEAISHDNKVAEQIEETNLKFSQMLLTNPGEVDARDILKGLGKRAEDSKLKTRIFASADSIES